MNIRVSEPLLRGKFETCLQRPDYDFLHVHQVHGAEIVSPQTLPAEADGIVVSWEEFTKPIAIKTADCLPIVIEGEKGVVFLHAGWKGLSLQILLRPEIALIKPTLAYIGPSIHSCCFEVSEDFRHNFPSSIHFKARAGKLFFDLQEEATKQLRSMYPDLEIKIDSHCTFCSENFHSYRKDKTTQRNWNIYIKG